MDRRNLNEWLVIALILLATFCVFVLAISD